MVYMVAGCNVWSIKVYAARCCLLLLASVTFPNLGVVANSLLLQSY